VLSARERLEDGMPERVIDTLFAPISALSSTFEKLRTLPTPV